MGGRFTATKMSKLQLQLLTHAAIWTDLMNSTLDQTSRHKRTYTALLHLKFSHGQTNQNKTTAALGGGSDVKGAQEAPGACEALFLIYVMVTRVDSLWEIIPSCKYRTYTLLNMQYLNIKGFKNKQKHLPMPKTIRDITAFLPQSFLWFCLHFT